MLGARRGKNWVRAFRKAEENRRGLPSFGLCHMLRDLVAGSVVGQTTSAAFGQAFGLAQNITTLDLPNCYDETR